jgi:hypothetical protein
MTFHHSHDGSLRAFTRLELAAVITSLLLLLAIVVPLTASSSFRSNQTGCLNNLRQIGIAFQAWGNDYEDRRPWFVLTNEGGSARHPFRANAFLHYTFLSNHISPSILIDPAEMSPAKRVAVNWSASQGGFLNPGFANNALSYMLSLHTSPAEANNILVGDRHLQFDGAASCPVGGRTAVQRLAAGTLFRGWTNGLHGVAGNLLLNDGHVEYASQERLKVILSRPDDGFAGDHIVTPF